MQGKQHVKVVVPKEVMTPGREHVLGHLASRATFLIIGVYRFSLRGCNTELQPSCFVLMGSLPMIQVWETSQHCFQHFFVCIEYKVEAKNKPVTLHTHLFWSCHRQDSCGELFQCLIEVSAGGSKVAEIMVAKV